MPNNVIVAVGIAVWALISGLLVYIWRSDRAVLVDRLNKIETDRGTSIKELIGNPILTIHSHSLLCAEVWRHLNEKLDSMEKGIRLEIKNAILEAARNGCKK
jgi:hypothetical protein